MKHISQLDPASPEAKARIAKSRAELDRRAEGAQSDHKQGQTAQPTPAVME